MDNLLECDSCTLYIINFLGFEGKIQNCGHTWWWSLSSSWRGCSSPGSKLTHSQLSKSTHDCHWILWPFVTFVWHLLALGTCSLFKQLDSACLYRICHDIASCRVDKLRNLEASRCWPRRKGGIVASFGSPLDDLRIYNQFDATHIAGIKATIFKMMLSPKWRLPSRAQVFPQWSPRPEKPRFYVFQVQVSVMTLSCIPVFTMKPLLMHFMA